MGCPRSESKRKGGGMASSAETSGKPTVTYKCTSGLAGVAPALLGNAHPPHDPTAPNAASCLWPKRICPLSSADRYRSSRGKGNRR